jgi:hypothetical protein
LNKSHLFYIIAAIIGIALISGIVYSISQNGKPAEPVPIVNNTKPPIDNGTLECGEGTYEQNGTCVANPIPVCSPGELLNTTTLLCEKIPEVPPVIDPTPKPQPNITRTLIALGDVDCDEMIDPIKQRNPTLILILGDLCYDKDLAPFLISWGQLGNLLKCIIGNHDAKENAAGSKVIEDALKYCKNDQYVKFGNTILFLVNTNGDLNSQKNGIVKLLSNQTFMKPFKNFVLASHKPCENMEDAHHPVESKIAIFCQAINDAVPNGIKEFYLSGHDHIIAKAINEEGDTFFISGAGGRSHYDCGKVEGIWLFCDDSNFGFLELKIEPDGTVKDNFYNVRGETVQ